MAGLMPRTERAGERYECVPTLERKLTIFHFRRHAMLAVQQQQFPPRWNNLVYPLLPPASFPPFFYFSRLFTPNADFSSQKYSCLRETEGGVDLGYLSRKVIS